MSQVIAARGMKSSLNVDDHGSDVVGTASGIGLMDQFIGGLLRRITVAQYFLELRMIHGICQSVTAQQETILGDGLTRCDVEFRPGADAHRAGDDAAPEAAIGAVECVLGGVIV